MSQHKLDPARRVRFIPLDRNGNPLPKREQARIEREQQEGDRQRAEARALERQQSELIEQFERQQLKTKDWISFAEIIDWRSRQGASGVPSADNEKVALDDLWREVSAGVIFYTEGRSHVLLTSLDYPLTDVLLTDLSALPATAWVTRERWLSWRDIGPDHIIDRLLRSCWVPRALCLKFAASVPFRLKADWVGDDWPQEGSTEAPPSRKRLTGTAVTLPRRRRGPNPAVTTAAQEKLRHMLRTGEIKPFQLENSIEDGGLKQESLAKMLGVASRSTAKSVIISVLAEEEFFKPRQTPAIAK
jgi:hypothetical protein